MEHGPFEDVFPLEHGYFAMLVYQRVPFPKPCDNKLALSGIDLSILLCGPEWPPSCLAFDSRGRTYFQPLAI